MTEELPEEELLFQYPEQVLELDDAVYNELLRRRVATMLNDIPEFQPEEGWQAASFLSDINRDFDNLISSLDALITASRTVPTKKREEAINLIMGAIRICDRLPGLLSVSLGMKLLIAERTQKK